MDDYITRRKFEIPGVCYWLPLLIVCGLILSVYFLVTAYIDPQKTELKQLSEIIDIWNNSFSIFNNTKIEIFSKDFESGDMIKNYSEISKKLLPDFPKYTPLSFVFYAKIQKDINEFKVTTNETGEINITSDIEFFIESLGYSSDFTLSVPVHKRHIYPAVEKTCKNAKFGYWNRTSQRCYYQSNLVSICLLLDSNFNLSEIYQLGCDSTSYVEYSPISWTSNDSYSFLETDIFIQVRSSEDPFVYASYNSLVVLSSPRTTYLAIGFTFLSVSAIFSIIFLISCRVYRRSYAYLEKRDKKSLK